jgi:hypothetical protein
MPPRFSFLPAVHRTERSVPLPPLLLGRVSISTKFENRCALGRRCSPIAFPHGHTPSRRNFKFSLFGVNSATDTVAIDFLSLISQSSGSFFSKELLDLCISLTIVFPLPLTQRHQMPPPSTTTARSPTTASTRALPHFLRQR